MFRNLVPMFMALLAPLAVTAANDAFAAEPRPNVLFIVSDDQRWDMIGAVGNAEVRTPTLDALAKRGHVFTNVYCMGSMVGAVRSPSRTMLMTGKSLWRIPQPAAKTYDEPTLGSIFRKAGYDTLFVGKKGNTFQAGNAAFETVVHDESRGDKKAGRAGSSQFHADTTLDWLKARKGDKPFLIYFAPPVPHDPRVAPEEYMRMYPPDKVTLPASFMPAHPFDNGELLVRDEKLAPHPRTPAEMRQHLAAYYACVSNLDHHVGRVLDALRESGQLERTLVVYTSDHGLAVGGMHGLMGKQNLYEHNKPPLVLAGPGVPAGKSDALVYLFDLLPTVADFAKLPAPGKCEGASLLPVVRGERKGVRDTLMGAYRDCQRMVRDERWKLIAYNAGGVRNTQLFDLSKDPDELRNLAEDPRHAEERARMEKLLAAERKRFDDPVDFEHGPAGKTKLKAKG